MECGVWVTVQDGRVIESEGDESAFQSVGNYCAKGQASLQAAYHPDRLRYPHEAHQPRRAKTPSWQRISWDEAYDTIGGRHRCQPGQVRQGNLHLYGRHRRVFGPWPPTAPSSSCSAAPTAFRPTRFARGRASTPRPSTPPTPTAGWKWWAARACSCSGAALPSSPTTTTAAVPRWTWPPAPTSTSSWTRARRTSARRRTSG